VRAPYLEVADRSLLAETVRIYEKTQIDFVDCLLFVRARNQGGKVLSFDRDFERLAKKNL
jgi:predicted nucleic acid-binding protein